MALDKDRGVEIVHPHPDIPGSAFVSKASVKHWKRQGWELAESHRTKQEAGDSKAKAKTSDDKTTKRSGAAKDKE